MGENGEYPYDVVAVGGSEWVWAKATTLGNKPLIGHNVKFVPARVVVLEQNPTTNQMITKIFTTDFSEVQEHENDPTFEVTPGKDISALVAKYITLPEAVVSDAQGVCKGQITLKKGSDFAVTTFDLALEDQGVFVP